MGKHTSILPTRGGTAGVEKRAPGRRSRASRTLPLAAFGAAVALVIVPMIDPSAAFAISDQAQFEQDYGAVPEQSVVASGIFEGDVQRDDFTITQEVIKKAEASVPSVGKPDPGSAKAIAYDIVQSKGWNDKQYGCLVALWNRESHWNVYASNGGSGAYGIPQALPGSKMGSAGPNWQSNAETQIRWGIGYIAGRYGSPCGAWASSQARGWY